MPRYILVHITVSMRRLLAAVLVLIAPAFARADAIRVAAAISLKDAITEVAKAYEATTGDHVELAFGSSGQLMSQIRSGAEIDLFLSAAVEQVDALAKDGLVDLATRRDVVGNTLVLVVPAEANAAPSSFADLASATVQKIAVGEPKTVPAGQYARQALASLKLDAAIAAKLVYGTNVRQVLNYVERGEVSAGLVYATDARQSGGKVRIVAVAPADSHAPIVYPGVVLANAKHAAAAERFLASLIAADAQKTFATYGFTTPPVAATQPAGPR